MLDYVKHKYLIGDCYFENILIEDYFKSKHIFTMIRSFIFYSNFVIFVVIESRNSKNVAKFNKDDNNLCIINSKTNSSSSIRNEDEDEFGKYDF